ncbi:hypothetical protein [Natronomonas sp. EA1]|uniref:hypothetical protein n=1 Tax=Natronomonas sp. EA1 TaxID=3421655 RepID=UPI003EBF3EDE
MPIKGSGATQLREIDRFDGGFGWIAYPKEGMQRASHALVSDGKVYVVDPVDADGLDDLLAEEGEVAGVVVLLDRHLRDAATIANRHDVAVHIPAWMSGVEKKLDAPVERLGDALGDTGYEVRRLVDSPFWKEAALYHEGSGTLLVPETLGTVDYYTTGDEQVGVHPALRLFPPSQLRPLAVERLLVGHGAGVLENAEAHIEDAVSGSRKRAPRAWMESFASFLRS